MDNIISFKKSLILFSLIIFSVVIVVDIQYVDASKSSGTYLTQTGSNQVCGDRLCSEIPSVQRFQYSSSILINSPAEQVWNTANI